MKDYSSRPAVSSGKTSPRAIFQREGIARTLNAGAGLSLLGNLYRFVRAASPGAPHPAILSADPESVAVDVRGNGQAHAHAETEFATIEGNAEENVLHPVQSTVVERDDFQHGC